MFKILAFLAGITTLCFSNTLFFASQTIYWLSLIFILLTLRMLIRCSQRLIKKPELKTVTIVFLDCSILFLLAILYAQNIAQSQLNSRLPHNLDGIDIQITGTVLGLVEQRPLNKGYREQSFYQRFILRVDAFGSNSNHKMSNKNEYQPAIIQVNNYQYLPIKSGQQWQFSVRLKKPRGNSNPGSFDYLRHLLTQRIDATGYIRASESAQLINEGRAQWFTAIRTSRVAALSDILKSVNNPGLLSALLLGDRSQLSTNHRVLLQRTGTSHLLAISGLHIGVAALFAALVAKLFLWSFPNLMHYWARSLVIACAALPIAAFYAIVAGLSLSTRRALIMLVCFLTMMLLRRQSHLMQTLSLAALVILIIDPLSVLSPGFWFSFSAVAILLWLSRSIRFYTCRISNNNRDPLTLRMRLITNSKEKFIIFCMAQLAIFIAMPLVLSLFTGQGSLITPVANLLAIPLISLTVVPSGIAGLLSSYFSLSMADFFLNIADNCLSLILSLLESLETFAGYLRHGPLNIDPVSYHAPLNPLLFIITLTAIIVLLSRRALPAYAAALIIWLVVFNPFNFLLTTGQPALEKNELVITQLDVGQGSAILLSTANYHLLYDTGPGFSSLSNAASHIIEPYLAVMSITELNRVLVSHGDNDHSGGAMYLNEYGNVKDWLLGGSAKMTGKQQLRKCRAGQLWQQDGFSFEILHPSNAKDINEAPSTNENDQSCVLSVKVIGAKRALILLTGDIGRLVERQLVSTIRPKLASDLLFVPHHGSASSSSPSLLAAVQPTTALISAGFRNRYNHPHPTVLERYASRDIAVYRSDQLGAIQFIYRNGKWLGPYCARYRASHFWQDFDTREQCIGKL